MTRTRIIYWTIVCCLGSVLLFGGCKGKPEKPPEKAKEPVATVRQKVATPTLLIPEERPKEKPPPPPEEEKFEPRGPITVPPSEVPLARVVEEEIAIEVREPEEVLKALAAPSLPPAEEKLPPEAVPVAYKPKLVAAQTNVDVILDVSGSMAAPFAATPQSKFDLLREALYDVVYEMGQQQADFPRNIAVRLIGSKSPASERDCRDTELLAGLGEPNLGGLRKVLGKVRAQGTSPLALGLTKAQDDFPVGGVADRVIVLVADGGDNCDGDPCAAARALQEGPIKTTIHVVAFDISPAEEEGLRCIAEEGHGKYFLARNEGELRQALGDAVHSTVPYNLKLTALAAGVPMPFDLKVYKAGTEKIVRRDKSFGTKLLGLDPGTYDILIEYSSSPEFRKPSKILKGVEILATTRVEQTITFDLGQLVLAAVDNEGKLVPARFRLSKAGTTQPVAQMETGAEAKSFFLASGSYDIIADLVEGGPEARFTLWDKNREIIAGESAELTFRFQKGTLALRGLTTQKVAIPFLFQAYKSGRPDVLVASGAFTAEGGQVLLAPGSYDVLVAGTEPEMVASPRTKISGVEIRAADTTQITAIFEMGMLTLSAVDGQDNKLPASFVVRDHGTQMEMARLVSETGAPVEVPIPPGNYDVVASSLKSVLEPKPSVPVSNIKVAVDKPATEVVKFVLGTIRLRGRSTKERPIRTQFTIYLAATDEVVSQAPPSDDWMIFDLAPGTYDALAVNLVSEKEPKPMIWLRDIKVADGKTESLEAIFTAGKLKIIGRGPNNKIITCHFKVFKYGSDRELINGVT